MNMDVSRPMATLIPSLDGHVLEVLARTLRPVTGREVHRLTGAGSESGVRLVLARLVDHGLVQATRAGRATLYVANRDHIAWPLVEGLVNLRREFFGRVRELVASWQLVPVVVAVFGSTARGDGGVDSDIDLLVVRPAVQDEAWEQQLDGLREHVALWTGNACHIYDLTEDELAEHIAEAEPIVDEWRRDAVVLFGVPLNRLLMGGAA